LLLYNINHLIKSLIKQQKLRGDIMKKFVIVNKSLNTYFKNLIPEGYEIYPHCEDNIPKEAFIFTSKNLAKHILAGIGPDFEIVEF
jgi:hypothetical protein